MAPPAGRRRSCVVCGKYAKDKKTKPLIDQDDFWKQHSNEFCNGSEVRLKEFLRYFGISLNSVVAAVGIGDADNILDALVVCNDCNDWVLYGAFLKEKHLWVDRNIREKIRNAFIAGRLQYRMKSSVDAYATVTEQIRQCENRNSFQLIEMKRNA